MQQLISSTKYVLKEKLTGNREEEHLTKDNHLSSANRLAVLMFRIGSL